MGIRIEWTFYTYEKLSANVGKIIYTFENEQTPMPEEEILTFTSENANVLNGVNIRTHLCPLKLIKVMEHSMSDTPEDLGRFK